MRLIDHFTFLHWHFSTFLPLHRLAHFLWNIFTFFFIRCAASLGFDVFALLFVNRGTLLLRFLVITVFIGFFHFDGFGFPFLTFLTNFFAISSCDGFVNRFASSPRLLFAFTLRNLENENN